MADGYDESKVLLDNQAANAARLEGKAARTAAKAKAKADKAAAKAQARIAKFSGTR